MTPLVCSTSICCLRVRKQCSKVPKIFLDSEVLNDPTPICANAIEFCSASCFEACLGNPTSYSYFNAHTTLKTHIRTATASEAINGRGI